MRDLFTLDEVASARFAVALEQLVAGLGFRYRNVWIRREGDTLRCEAVSPWAAPGLHEPEALELIAHAQDVFGELAAEPAFVEATTNMTPRFAVIQDYGTGTEIVAEYDDGRFEWQTAARLPAD